MRLPRNFVLPLVFVACLAIVVISEEERNIGQLIGKLNVYHHGVSGELYAINETTLLVKHFYYDGFGKDVFFWAGNTGTGPSLNGFIVPDQFGRTNVLKKTSNADFTLKLPDKKKISELKWIAVYDLSRLESYGDVYIPDGFTPPGILKLPPFISKSVHECNSGEILINDFKTITIKDFNLFVYDDQELYFLVGKGHVPTRSGSTKIPDDLGYFEPLRRYDDATIILTLPGTMTFDDVHWLAVYDMVLDKPLAYVNIPNNAHIPPSLLQIVPYESSLPNCQALHRNLYIAWDVVGQTITFELIGLADTENWLGIGISGSPNRSQMIHADVAIAYLDKVTGLPMANDYRIDSKAPCSLILDNKRGVCKDSDLGGSDSIQVLEGRQQDHILSIKFRRQLSKSDEYDAVINATQQTSIIWAMGRLLPNGQPGFHRIYPKQHTQIIFSKKEKVNDCPPFVIFGPRQEITPWSEFTIVDGKLRTFTARLGPSGDLRGYEGRTNMGSPGFAWYIQGLLTPKLYMQRGITYSFKVEGGNNPHNPEFYHPFVISNTPLLTNGRDEIILAGVETTRRGKIRPTAAGRLCMWTHGNRDRREDSRFKTFESYRNTLKLRCENGSQPSILTVTPNSSWPDVVYYHSYNAINMGNKIYVLDQLGSAKAIGGAAAVSILSGTTLMFIILLSSSFIYCYLN